MDSKEDDQIDDLENKRIKEAKGYKKKIKRHRDAILNIYSVDGKEGELLISGSADHSVRSKWMWKLPGPISFP